MNRTLTVLMLAGLIGAATLGADAPATQPAAAPDPAVTTPAPTNDAANQANQGGRTGRRGRNNRTDTGGAGGTGGSASSGSIANPAGLDKYAVLKTRSIFIKGNQIVLPENSHPPFIPSNNNGLANKRSSSLVFNGVIVMGDEPNAMIEDQSSNGTVSLLRVGDRLAAGRLSSVTFDDITYEANGTQKRIFLGQNMDGETPTVAVAPPPAPPSTQPGAAGAAPAGTAPAAGGGDDVLAKMRAKRNAELGIK
jgi:hypothetical protein